ncbi:unnamed protein product [Protopolystoma xenopodis]|uniref:Uncharacterized protein n=1 Tax=Protopolystoma xenopodis TaxID=117903 RepID=A0A448XN92_9PLAT|nr:unnamed protein product [Protopolystoma xenopodis]
MPFIGPRKLRRSSPANSLSSKAPKINLHPWRSTLRCRRHCPPSDSVPLPPLVPRLVALLSLNPLYMAKNTGIALLVSLISCLLRSLDLSEFENISMTDMEQLILEPLPGTDQTNPCDFQKSESIRVPSTPLSTATGQGFDLNLEIRLGNPFRLYLRPLATASAETVRLLLDRPNRLLSQLLSVGWLGPASQEAIGDILRVGCVVITADKCDRELVTLENKPTYLRSSLTSLSQLGLVVRAT